jgi:ERCC4-related helicase
LNRRETLGISNTLVRELEKGDIMEYTAMFKMDKEKVDVVETC